MQLKNSLTDNKSINPIYYLGLILIVSMFSFQSCTEGGTPATDEQVSIINHVVNDIFKNQNYEMVCKIDPLLGSADQYNGDFTSIITPGLVSLQNGDQIRINMNKAPALSMTNIDKLDSPELLKIEVRTVKDTIPNLANRSNVILNMSTIGFSDDHNECVIIADRIFGTASKTRFIYYFRKNNEGEYLQVDKKTIFHFDPVQNLNIGFQKKKVDK